MQMKKSKRIVAILMALVLLVCTFVVNFAVSAEVPVLPEDLAEGDILYENDFSEEETSYLPEGWSEGTPSFMWGGSDSAGVAEVMYDETLDKNVMYMDSSRCHYVVGLPQIETTDYVYEATFYVVDDGTAHQFGLANNINAADVNDATGVTYLAFYTNSNSSYKPHHLRQATDGSEISETKLEFPEGYKYPVGGSTVTLKLVSYKGYNYYYFNDLYVGAFKQAENNSGVDTCGVFTGQRAICMTNVKITEVYSVEGDRLEAGAKAFDFEETTLDINGDAVSLNVAGKINKESALYSNNVSGDYSANANFKFGYLVGIGDNAVVQNLKVDTEGIENYIISDFTQDSQKVSFSKTLNLSAEEYDNFYTVRGYIAIEEDGETVYYYGDSDVFCAATMANTLYTTSKDETFKAKLEKIFANSQMYIGANGKEVSFTVFSDLHYINGHYAATVKDLQTIFDRANANNSDFVLSAGDFSNDFNGSPEITNAFLKNKYGLKAYNVYGNHELETHATMADVTPKLTNDENVVWGTSDGKISPDGSIGYYYFEKNGFRVICLDTNYSLGGAWEHNKPNSYGPPSGNAASNSLGPVQLAWLKKVLTEAADAGTPCIVMSHHSFAPDFVASADAEPVRNMFKEVNAIHPGTVIAAINGHWHTNRQQTYENVLYLDINTVRNGYWRNDSMGIQKYSEGMSFDFIQYDRNGLPTISQIMDYKDLPGSGFTQWFHDPVSANVTVNQNGVVTVEGFTSRWAYDLVPQMQGDEDADYTVPYITSGTYTLDFN